MSPGVSQCFNSLQTGKSFRTVCIQQKLMIMVGLVSIPFKRESPFGQHRSPPITEGTIPIVSIPFKRESPFGLQRITPREKVSTNVSIPFKRESPFGRNNHKSQWGKDNRFNSLQTGKSFRTISKWYTLRQLYELFQFPSNGKVLSDAI